MKKYPGKVIAVSNPDGEIFYGKDINNTTDNSTTDNNTIDNNTAIVTLTHSPSPSYY